MTEDGMLIRKSYLEKVRPFVGLDVVKVITGMRRSGKSVLMEQIRDEIILKDDPRATVFYLNLEEEENAKFLKNGVLHEQVLKVIRKAKGKRVAVFLDEIHEVEDWEITVNSLRAKKNVDVYVTGSNSKLLSGELATYLTGRYVEIKVSPYSFADFREASAATFGTLSREEVFRRYLDPGSIRVNRGGCYLNFVQDCRSDYRNYNSEGVSGSCLGFRPVSIRLVTGQAGSNSACPELRRAETNMLNSCMSSMRTAQSRARNLL